MFFWPQLPVEASSGSCKFRPNPWSKILRLDLDRRWRWPWSPDSLPVAHRWNDPRSHRNWPGRISPRSIGTTALFSACVSVHSRVQRFCPHESPWKRHFPVPAFSAFCTALAKNPSPERNQFPSRPDWSPWPVHSRIPLRSCGGWRWPWAGTRASPSCLPESQWVVLWWWSHPGLWRVLFSFFLLVNGQRTTVRGRFLFEISLFS